MNLPSITSAVEAIAKEAGAFLRIQQADFSQERVSLKSLNALVSDVDENTERLLVNRLSELIPQAGFLTEEETTKQDIQKEWVWIIDPLDGTTNFVHGLPIYSVSIALKHKDKLVIGVVYEIGMDECFSAYSDGGARLNGQSIQVTETDMLENSLLATGFPYYDFEHMEGFQNTLTTFYKSTRGLRRIGTAAVDLAYTSCGRFDGYFEYGLSPWDVAAGIVLVREAGGIISDFNGGPEAIASKSIVATNKRLYPSVLKVVRKNMGNA
ncbi:MAG: inositol monophosphatase family protein [Schleiferiaceae bacterium]|nr:inositol monophosphatase family protein [Schleiferiaceae bacterium]MDG1313144.1 inositol monophosphatase family protein [Schleiferiaceae bacterium]MDG1918508.1 inositol monophosphatase family protein [Schleiferiaceae bacterium]